MKMKMTLSTSRKNRIKQEVMDFVVAHPRSLSPTPSFGWRGWWQPAIGGLLVLLVSVSFGGVLAQEADPGDWLYPIKRWSENRRLAWINNPEDREAWIREMTQRRISELDTIITTDGDDSYSLVKETRDELASVASKSSDEGLRQMVSERLAAMDQIASPEMDLFEEKGSTEASEASASSSMETPVATSESEMEQNPVATAGASERTSPNTATPSGSVR